MAYNSEDSFSSGESEDDIYYSYYNNFNSVAKLNRDIRKIKCIIYDIKTCWIYSEFANVIRVFETELRKIELLCNDLITMLKPYVQINASTNSGYSYFRAHFNCNVTNSDSVTILKSGHKILPSAHKSIFLSFSIVRKLYITIRYFIIYGEIINDIFDYYSLLCKVTPSSDTVYKFICTFDNMVQKWKDMRNLNVIDLISSQDTNAEYDWESISLSIFNGHYTAKDCKQLWDLIYKPRRKWSSFEITKLWLVVKNNNFEDWKKIALELGTDRSEYECFLYYCMKYKANIDVSRIWLQKEIKYLSTHSLLHCIEYQKYFLKWRTTAQIIYKWKRIHKIHPVLKSFKHVKKCVYIENHNRKWNYQRLKYLIELISIFGFKWVTISKYMVNVCGCICRYQYFKLRRSNRRFVEYWTKFFKRCYGNMKRRRLINLERYSRRFVKPNKENQAVKNMFLIPNVAYNKVDNNISSVPSEYTIITELMKFLNIRVETNEDCSLITSESRNNSEEISTFSTLPNVTLHHIKSEPYINPNYFNLKRQTILRKYIYDSYIFPPNKLNILGFHRITENYKKLVATKCKPRQINLEKVWQEIENQSHDEQFFKSLALLYQTFKTFIFWSVIFDNYPSDSFTEMKNLVHKEPQKEC